MYTFKSQKPENLCNNIYFLLFFAKKSRQKRLRLTKNAVLLLPRSGGAKKTRRTMERRLRLFKFVWLKQFLASSASTQAKPAFF
jgi:hypothetical protein